MFTPFEVFKRVHGRVTLERAWAGDLAAHSIALTAFVAPWGEAARDGEREREREREGGIRKLRQVIR